MSPQETFPITIGSTFEVRQVVTLELTAAHIGSGSLRVLGTPAMLMLIEEASRRLVDPLLPEGHSTVGVSASLRHLAATPVGVEVRARSQVISHDGRLVTFRVEVWDETEKIGEADHQRVVIEEERFLKRVQAKSTA